MKKKLYERVTKEMTKAMIGIFIALFAIFVALSTVPSESKFLLVGKFIHWCVSFLVGSVFSYIFYTLVVLFGVSLIFTYKRKLKITLDYTLFGFLLLFIGSLILIANSISYDASTSTELTFANFGEYFNNNMVATFPNVDTFKNGGIIGLFLVALINSGMTYIGSNVIGSVILVLGAIFVLGKPSVKFFRYLRNYASLIKTGSPLNKENEFYSAKDINYNYKEIRNTVPEEGNAPENEQNLAKIDAFKDDSLVRPTPTVQESKKEYYQPENEKDELVLNPTLGLVRAVYDPNEEQVSVKREVSNNYVQEQTQDVKVVVDDFEVDKNIVEEEVAEDDILENENIVENSVENATFAQETPVFETQEQVTMPVQEPVPQQVYENKTEVKKRKRIVWRNVSDKFLEDRESKDADEENIRVSEERTSRINIILNDLGVRARVTSYTIGPSVTRFDVLSDKTTKIIQVSRCMPDVFQRLGGVEGRFTPIVAGKTTAGIELPNVHTSVVNFKECYQKLSDDKDKLDVVFGKNINGEIICGDICEFPHLLVAGTTGSGKSIFVHGMILSLLMNHSPEDLKFVLIDPKRVEMSKYKEIPHLLCPVINDPTKAYVALLKLCREMDDRYTILERTGCSKISEYNRMAEEKGLEKMTYVVVVIDEFADLMDTNRKCSEPVARLGQKARACGIHLIVATQRPSVDVITGVIKANIPSRVALACSSPQDSVTILSEGGAQNLLGKGDMLISCGALSRKELLRVQGCYVSNDEIRRVCDYLRENYEVNYNEEFLDLEQRSESTVSVSDLRAEKEAADGEKYEEIKNWVMTNDYTSISKIQTKFQLGFPKASKYFQKLAEEGVISNVSEANNAKGRKVLMHDFSKIAEDSQVRGGSLEQSTMDYSKRGDDF